MLPKAWAWCLAHPEIALIVLGALSNLCTRLLMSSTWEVFQTKHPRLAGVLLVLKALFPEGGTALRGIVQAAKGTLEKRIEPKPPTKA